MTDKKKSAVVETPAPGPKQQSGCVVCGSYEGELSEKAGDARWHKACGSAQPNVIRKVKARA